MIDVNALQPLLPIALKRVEYHDDNSGLLSIVD